jgi:hypothetical protein
MKIKEFAIGIRPFGLSTYETKFAIQVAGRAEHIREMRELQFRLEIEGFRRG